MPIKPNLLVPLLIAALGHAAPAAAQTIYQIGPQALAGVPIGTEAEAAVAALTAKLGTGKDSGWVDGCEFNGILERYIDWGGLTASFEETSHTGFVFTGWSYRLDGETGMAIPGGPALEQFALPNGVKLGDRFSDVSRAFGIDPEIDDVFGVGFYSGRYFELMSPSDNIDDPVTEVAVPFFARCD